MEEALDLSFDRLLMMMMMISEKFVLASKAFEIMYLYMTINDEFKLNFRGTD